MAPKVTKPKKKPRSKAKAKPTLPAASNTSISTSSKTSDPLFFYGHTSGPYDFLSQHYACTFTAPPLYFPSPSSNPSSTNISSSSANYSPTKNLTFLSTEQFMMYHKALLFGDADVAAQIMATPAPAAQKALGRQVHGFDEGVWKANRERIVEEGNWWKFINGTGTGEEAKGLRERLLETGERELVEASPRDRIWGIGFGRNNAEANRGRWGLNLLGKALIRVRERLREQGEEGKGKGDEKVADEKAS
jgi:ribA/ribD-fused uncharacterized protein